jgi:hypothetical protein
MLHRSDVLEFVSFLLGFRFYYCVDYTLLHIRQPLKHELAVVQEFGRCDFDR